MSGLVSYESSSEEEQSSITKAQTVTTSSGKAAAAAPQANSLRKTSLNVSVPRSGERAEADAIVQHGPMVGPTMPDQLGNETIEQEERSPEPQQQMSERETIHYLTQATHPMKSIPPSPPGSPDPAMNAKFKRFLEFKAKGVHFNKDLGNKSTFRNPGLLGTMMTRARLEEADQYKTSLPQDIWDPSGFPPSAYKEELLRSQQSLREQEQATKRNLTVAGKRTIEFTSGGTSGPASRESTPGMPNKRKRP